MFITDYIKKHRSKVSPVDPHDNPLAENICMGVPITINGSTVDLDVRWIKNASGEIKGGQATLEFSNEKVPITIAGPYAQTFSVCVPIALEKVLVPGLKEEVARLQEEGKISQKAQLIYNPDYQQVLFYRCSDTKPLQGNIARWKDAVKGNLQPLLDDFVEIMPYIMKLYGVKDED